MGPRLVLAVFVVPALLVLVVGSAWATRYSEPLTWKLALAKADVDCPVAPELTMQAEDSVWLSCGGDVHELSRQIHCAQLPPCTWGFEFACYDVRTAVPPGALPDAVQVAFAPR